MNRAPVARATARLAIASHRTLTPNGTRIVGPQARRSRPPSRPGPPGRPRAGRGCRPRCRTGPRRRRPPGATSRSRPTTSTKRGCARPPRRGAAGPAGRGSGASRSPACVVPKIRSSAVHRSLLSLRPAVAGCARSHRRPPRDHDLDAQRGQGRELVRRRPGIGHERADPRSRRSPPAFVAIPIFEPSAIDDQPRRPLDRQALDLGVGVVELGQAPARAEAGGADARPGRSGSARAVAAATGPTQVSSSRRTEPPSETTSIGRVPSRLAIGSDGGHRHEPGPDRQEPRELLGRRADPDEEHPARRRAAGVARIPIRRFSRVFWSARALNATSSDFGQVGGRAAVRLADEPVALEPADVAPDRHLRHAERVRASSATWIVCSSATRSRMRWRRSTAAEDGPQRSPDDRPHSIRHRSSPNAQQLLTNGVRLCSTIDAAGRNCQALPPQGSRRRRVRVATSARGPRAVSSSSGRAPAWCARPRRSTRRSSTRSSPRRSARRSRGACSSRSRCSPGRPRRGDADLGDPQHPGPDHDGAAGLEHAPDRRRLRLGQPDPERRRWRSSRTSAPRCRR